ncbi:MAG: hypothetical protein ABIH82_03955 [Candidatus Woesearchaeota archaeon]
MYKITYRDEKVEHLDKFEELEFNDDFAEGDVIYIATDLIAKIE